MTADERRRVVDGPLPDEEPDGTLVAVDAVCDDATQVLARCREVLTVVLDHSDGEWPTDEEWLALLPDWFVAASAPELTPDEAERYRARWEAMSYQERLADAASQKPWSVSDWIFWFDPDDRHWFWWDAEVRSTTELRVWIQVDTWPAPVGSLEWLLRAAGAREVIVDP
jgi:hypothetical protein